MLTTKAIHTNIISEKSSLTARVTIVFMAWGCLGVFYYYFQFVAVAAVETVVCEGACLAVHDTRVTSRRAFFLSLLVRKTRFSATEQVYMIDLTVCARESSHCLVCPTRIALSTGRMSVSVFFICVWFYVVPRCLFDRRHRACYRG